MPPETTDESVRLELARRALTTTTSPSRSLDVPCTVLDRNGELVVTTGDPAVRCDLTTWVGGDVLAPRQGLTADTEWIRPAKLGRGWLGSVCA
jgi:hypothetical protein